VGVVARDHVVLAVAIDVEDEHLRPAAGPGLPEGPRVKGPDRIFRDARGLLEPAVFYKMPVQLTPT
jgi:hypothetical protein